jgi:hypothetical protein
VRGLDVKFAFLSQFETEIEHFSEDELGEKGEWFDEDIRQESLTLLSYYGLNINIFA